MYVVVVPGQHNPHVYGLAKTRPSLFCSPTQPLAFLLASTTPRFYERLSIFTQFLPTPTKPVYFLRRSAPFYHGEQLGREDGSAMQEIHFLSIRKHPKLNCFVSQLPLAGHARPSILPSGKLSTLINPKGCE